MGARIYFQKKKFQLFFLIPQATPATSATNIYLPYIWFHEHPIWMIDLEFIDIKRNPWISC